MNRYAVRFMTERLADLRYSVTTNEIAGSEICMNFGTGRNSRNPPAYPPPPIPDAAAKAPSFGKTPIVTHGKDT